MSVLKKIESVDLVAQAIEAGAKRQSELIARPTHGDHKTQLANAFGLAFNRYHKAFEELAKI